MGGEHARRRNEDQEGGATLKIKGIAYWVTTAMLAFGLLSGGAAQLAHQRETVTGIVHLGYPVYFITMIGF